MPPTDDAPPPASGSRPSPLGAFLDAWDGLCEAGGRRSLYAARALEAGTADQRAALADALTALGYPEATSSSRTLGATLRALRGRRAPDGRQLERRAGAAGSIWFVVPARVAA